MKQREQEPTLSSLSRLFNRNLGPNYKRAKACFYFFAFCQRRRSDQRDAYGMRRVK